MSERPEIESLEDALTYIDELESRLGDEPVGQIWPLEIRLDAPIQLGKKGEPISIITMREPRIGDIAGIALGSDGIKMDDLILIASRTTDLPRPLIRKVPGKHAGKLLGACRGFFTDCLGT